ncbi:MAG: DUF501 domain-containing protein [Candidatus Wallbacteria bacterium]|nr:DUF501 domain-containing protein [Candidatus Wallbacteria bacterium]
MPDADSLAIRGQLGREPGQAVLVAARCSWGVPSCIRCLPVEGGRPFPTLYWLTCPHLVYLVDRLEEEGLVASISEQICRDRRLLKRYRRETIRYIRERESLHRLRADHRGIGGLAQWMNPVKIKCLHMHVAYSLVYPEEIVAGLLGERIRGWCGNASCRGLVG